MDKTKVISGKPKVSGAIFRAPLGTPLPTDATSSLDSSFVELGYAHADGWARQIAKAYETLTAWGGDEVNKSRTEHGVTFSTTLIEDLNPDVHEAKWGEAAVTHTPADATHGNRITVTYKGAEPEPAVWVFDMNDQGKLIPRERAKGRKAAIRRLFEHLCERVDMKQNTYFRITHADCMDDALSLKQMLQEKFDNIPVYISMVGAVIGSHCGPGTLALFFIGEPRGE